jgi:hypothetical protein
MPVVRAAPPGIWLSYAQQDQRLVGIVRIDRFGPPLERPVVLRRLGGELCLTLGNHPQHLPSGGTVARKGILVGPVLKGFFDRDLARFAVLRDGEGSIDHKVKGRWRGAWPRLGAPLGIATLALAEPATGRRPARTNTAAHAVLPSTRSGVPPVIATQRSIATST